MTPPERLLAFRQGEIMMKALVLICTLLSSVWAQAHDLEGKWVGKGVWNVGASVVMYETQVTLDVKVTESQIILKDCWQPVPHGTQGKAICYDTTYDVKDGRIYFEGNWVGYLLSFEMTAFYGNNQVSEQIIIRRLTKDKIRFVYTYANFDGDSHYRVEELTRVP